MIKIFYVHFPKKREDYLFLSSQEIFLRVNLIHSNRFQMLFNRYTFIEKIKKQINYSYFFYISYLCLIFMKFYIKK